MLKKLGVFAEGFYKLFGKPFCELSNQELIDTTPKVFDYAAEHKCKCLEFDVAYEKLKVLQPVLARYADEFDLLLHEWDSFNLFSYKDKKKRNEGLKAIKCRIDQCKEAGIKLVDVHPPFYNPDGPDFHLDENAPKRLSKTEAWEAAIPLYKESADYAFSCKVKLSLENMPARDDKLKPYPLFGITKEDITKMVSAIDSQGLFVTFDTGHCNTCRYKLQDGKIIEDKPASYIAGFIEAIIDKIAHIHLHDNDGSFDQHKPIGKGSLPFDVLLDTLNRLNYTGTIAIEREIENKDDTSIFRDLARLNVLC